MKEKEHRRTHETVPNRSQLDGFRPADAVERLHAAILRVDTIAQIASDAVEQLPSPADLAARRAFTRTQILVEKAAGEARAALDEADAIMAALTHHLEMRACNIPTRSDATQAHTGHESRRHAPGS